jgi:hypothetical protein
MHDVLSDYALIRDDVDSVREAADRMGMTFAALDQALYRARRKGLSGALPPPRQLERGLVSRVSSHLVSEGLGGRWAA